MKQVVLGVVVALFFGGQSAAALFDDKSNTNQQGQAQLQGQQQGQQQAAIAAAVAAAIAAQGQIQGQAVGQNVNVPRQHRNVPNVSIQTAPRQSGVGVSGPGFSAGAVETEGVDNALRVLDFCASEQVDCDQEDIAVAKAAALRSVKGCYLLGPVGKLLSLIPKVEVSGLPYEDVGGILKPLCW